MLTPIAVPALALGLVALSLTGRSERPQPAAAASSSSGGRASGFVFSVTITEDAIGAPTAREALNVWVSEASGLSTKLLASQWVQTDASDDAVRFQGEGDWATATRITNGWMVLEAGNSGQ